MSNLSSLKLVAAKPRKGENLREARRFKLVEKIDTQLLLARAQHEGTPLQLTRIKTAIDLETGLKQKIELPRKIKPWWWNGENGKTNIALKYGSKVIEISPGLNAIETEGVGGVITTLEVLKSAVLGGELDAQIEGLNKKTSAGLKRPTLSLKGKN